MKRLEREPVVNGQYCFSTLITPEMERKKGMRERKSQGMMYQSQDLSVPGSTCLGVHWDLCLHLGWNVVYSIPPSTSTHCHTTTGYSRTTAIHLQRFLKGFCSGVTGLDVEDVFPLENNHLISQRCISQRSSRHEGLENALLQVVI